MGGKGGSKPDTLSGNDMIGIAQEEGRLNQDLLRQQTTANRPDQYNPWGTTVWEDLGNDRWSQTVGINPDAQRALEAQENLGAERSELAGDLFGTAREDLSQPISWEAMEANEVGTGADARQNAEDAIYGRATSRLDPIFGQKREAKENQLWNQGLRPGDEAYDTAMDNFGRQENDAYQTAMNESIMGGGAEASRTFGLDMSRRQQALAEQLKRRGQSLSEVQALESGQGVQMPDFGGFSQQGQGQTPDLMGAASAGQRNEWDRYNARQSEVQGTQAGIAGLAGAALPFLFSDRRLKSNIVHLGFTPGGQRVYEYDIFGTHQIGVMADESPPEAVSLHPSGYLMVDYSRIK